MAFYWNRFPYTNNHELNLDWFNEHFKEIFEEWANLYNALIDWKNDTDTDLAQWKEDTLADMDTWERELLAALDEWKTDTGNDISDWESDIISDLNDWKEMFLAAYESLEDRVEAIVSDTEDMVENLAEPFSTSENYSIGDYVIYNGVLYKFTSNHTAGAWNASDVTQTTAMEDISNIANNIKTKLGTNGTDVTLLSENADLYSLPIGMYYSNSSALTATLTNKPSGLTGGFKLFIYWTSASSRFGAMLWSVTGRLYLNQQGSGGYLGWQELVRNGDLETTISSLIDTLENRFTALLSTEKIYNNLIDKTINMLDSSRNTNGYILVDNIPTAFSNYYYTDYIEIGETPFCYRDQGATISSLCSCYDKDKNYIDYIDYNHNSDRYERIQNTSPSGYYKITPLPGTVYVRLNGRYTSNLMMCPFFYPEIAIDYNETYTKHALKMAMFGDSITLGTDGDTGLQDTQNLSYWLHELCGFEVDNYGQGSMGWVSTAYLNNIAYDAISAVDLTKYDVITLCYGVNDSAATMGAYNSSDDTTIMGQVNKCIKYIGAENPNAIIILIAVWNGRKYGTFPEWRYGTTTSGGFTRAELSEEERKAAEYYHIGFISQLDSPLNGFGLGTAASEKTGPFMGSDDVHPSVAGYNALGHWLAGKISAICKIK